LRPNKILDIYFHLGKGANILLCSPVESRPVWLEKKI
jgi:hypothetical protein